jgi:hypothetical protein
MAPKYWINGGGGFWYDSLNWSATSGGTSGEFPPGLNDDVYFDSNGTGVCVLDLTSSVINSFTMTDGTMDFNHSMFGITHDLNVRGNALLLKSGLENATIDVSGDASIIGRADNYMDLIVEAPWKLTVSGSATVTRVNVANSNAGHGSTIDASYSGNGMFNNNWNFIPDIPSDSINYFEMFPKRDGREVISKIVPSILLNRATEAGGGTYFNDMTKISRIDIVYFDPAGREQKRIIHIGINFEGSVSWSSEAVPGLWTAQKARLVDSDGAELFIGRDILGDHQDINLI